MIGIGIGIGIGFGFDVGLPVGWAGLGAVSAINARSRCARMAGALMPVRSGCPASGVRELFV